MKNQKGAAMVEFAPIALLFFALLFGIIEFGRAFFVYNTLVEATRRGARVATVCPVSENGITLVKQITIFDTPGGTSTPLLGLTENNIRVSYLNSDFNTVAWDTSPLTSVTNPIYDDIAFVRVSIDQDANAFLLKLFIPPPIILPDNTPWIFSNSFKIPPIVTVLPSESLGRVTAENPVTKRCCYGKDYDGTLCTP